MFPSENPFPHSDKLLRELAVLAKVHEVAQDLGRALKHAYQADTLTDSYSDRSTSVEVCVGSSAPNAQAKVRELRGWFEDGKDYEITTVPGTVPHPNIYENLAYLRKGYELLTYFVDLVQREKKSFPDPFMRKLEVLVLEVRDLQAGAR